MKLCEYRMKTMMRNTSCLPSRYFSPHCTSLSVSPDLIWLLCFPYLFFFSSHLAVAFCHLFILFHCHTVPLFSHFLSISLFPLSPLQSVIPPPCLTFLKSIISYKKGQARWLGGSPLSNQPSMWVSGGKAREPIH